MTNIQCIVFNAKYANRWISSIDSILHSLTTGDNDGGERLASASVKFKRQEDNTKKRYWEWWTRVGLCILTSSALESLVSFDRNRTIDVFPPLTSYCGSEIVLVRSTMAHKRTNEIDLTQTKLKKVICYKVKTLPYPKQHVKDGTLGQYFNLEFFECLLGSLL